MKKRIFSLVCISIIFAVNVSATESAKEVSFQDVFDSYQSSTQYVDTLLTFITGKDIEKEFGYFDSKYSASSTGFYDGELNALHYVYSYGGVDDAVKMGDYIRITAEVGNCIELRGNNTVDNTFQLAEIDRNGKYRIGLVEDSWNITYDNQLFIRTDDDSFKQLRQGSVATIEGYYMPYGRITDMDSIYDCKLIEFH